MHRFFVSRDEISSDSIKLYGENAEHIFKVLRLRRGDKIIVCDGEENEYVCMIEYSDKKTVSCSIIEKGKSSSEPDVRVHIFQGIPKAAKMDIIIQKCTELGMDCLTPVDTERVVVNRSMDPGIGSSFSNKLSRWQRIAEEASKQSGRGRIPKIQSPVDYNEMMELIKDYDLCVIPYEKEGSVGLKHVLRGKNNIKSIAVVIGPEGGFAEDEIKYAISKGAVPVTLGPRILRTETAGFACLSIIMYELGDLGGEPWKE